MDLYLNPSNPAQDMLVIGTLGRGAFEINVTPPDDLGVEIPASGIQKMLPWVMGGGMLGMIAIMIFTGIRQLSPYMLMMPLMMIMATVGFMAGGGPGGKRVPEINADRREYLRYLSGLRTRVTSSAAAQVTFFNYHAPHPDDLLSIIGTNRQWSRQANVDFYAATRIGLGTEPAVDRLLKPNVGGDLAGPQAAPQPHLEPGDRHAVKHHTFAVKRKVHKPEVPRRRRFRDLFAGSIATE